MAKYRKKPIVVEAVQWDGGDPLPGMTPSAIYCDPVQTIAYCISGAGPVQEGDWVVTGAKGEKYPVKPDVFAETYEAVGDGE